MGEWPYFNFLLLVLEGAILFFARMRGQAFVGGVLPRLSRGDEGALHTGAAQPAEHGKRDEAGDERRGTRF